MNLGFSFQIFTPSILLLLWCNNVKNWIQWIWSCANSRWWYTGVNYHSVWGVDFISMLYNKAENILVLLCMCKRQAPDICKTSYYTLYSIIGLIWDISKWKDITTTSIKDTAKWLDEITVLTCPILCRQLTTDCLIRFIPFTHVMTFFYINCTNLSEILFRLTLKSFTLLIKKH